MKRFLVFLLLFFIGILPTAAGNKVIFIHGWNPVGKEHQQEIAKLQEIFPDAEVVLHSWDAADKNFGRIFELSESEAIALADTLAALPDSELSNVILVGHSLGGRVAIRVMAKLAAQNRKIRRGIFLGAAINDDDSDIASAITASHLPNINIYNRQDYTLRHIFKGYSMAVGQKCYALGTFGTAEAVQTAQLRQLGMNDDSPVKTLDDYIARVELHLTMNYLVCLQNNLAGLTAEMPDSTDSSTIRESFTFEGGMTFEQIKWIPDELTLFFNGELLDIHRNWRLMHFSKMVEIWGRQITLHAYYIIDPRDNIVYIHCFESFAVTQFNRLKTQ